MQYLAYCPQLESVIVLQLKHHSLPGRELFERNMNPRTQLTPHQVALRIRSGTAVRHLVEQVVLAARGILRNRRVFLPHLLLAQVIEAQVGNDPVDPCVEGTLKAKTSDVLVGLQEG